MERPKLKRDWIGLIVKSVRPIETGNGWMPSGMVFTVVDSFNGLRLRAKRCECCGYAPFVSRVNESDVVILDRDDAVTKEYANYRRRRR